MEIEYFEDIVLHRKQRSDEYLLDQQDIIEFARAWNPRSFHVDPEVAKQNKVGGLFAAGPHLIAICSKLTAAMNPTSATIAGLGIDELRFLKAARPGDRLVLEREPIYKRESGSDPGAGIVTHAARLLNQDNEPVLSYKGTFMIERRPGDLMQADRLR